MKHQMPNEVKKGGAIFIAQVRGGFVAVEHDNNERTLGMIEVEDKNGEKFCLCLLESGIGDILRALDEMSLHFEKETGRKFETSGKLKVHKQQVGGEEIH